MKKLFLIGTLLCLLLVFLIGCNYELDTSAVETSDEHPTGCDYELDTSAFEVNDEQPINEFGFEVGRVVIIANGVEHELHKEPTHISSQVMSASIRHTPNDEIFDVLPEIQYVDDFQVIIEGDGATGAIYFLFDDDFEQVFTSMEYITFPNEPGLYILSISLAWRIIGHDYICNCYISNCYISNHFIYRVRVRK